MKVIGFVGQSGTGKSFLSIKVAKENSITHIIDDGILISGSHILAGYSAKREVTKLASIRRALFVDRKHAKEMSEAIAEENPEKILILGTSEAMVKKIAEVLALPPVSQIINIEDVATPEEIEKARVTRKMQGKHVIPVPTFEIKKDFSGYWMDTLRMLRKGPNAGSRFLEEKTVVRPTFSYLGEFIVADSVLSNIASYEANKIDGVSKVLSCSVIPRENGVEFNVSIIVKYKTDMQKCAKKIEKKIKSSIEYYTSINVLKANVNIKGLEY